MTDEMVTPEEEAVVMVEEEENWGQSCRVTTGWRHDFAEEDER
jgi:nitrogen fixation protein